MPRRKRLPPDIDPKRAFGNKPRGPHVECEACHGITYASKGVTLEQAVANHAVSCPAQYRINPNRKE